MATIYDVAKRAGVAISTVSKVLSGRHAVSDKTKKRVIKAVKELHYVPSSAARTLAGEPTNLIGVVIAADVPNLAGLLRGVDSEAKRRDGAVMITVAYTVDEWSASILRLVRGFQVDAVVLVGQTDNAALLVELGVRGVILAPDFAPDEAEKVGRQAARKLFTRT